MEIAVGAFSQVLKIAKVGLPYASRGFDFDADQSTVITFQHAVNLFAVTDRK